MTLFQQNKDISYLIYFDPTIIGFWIRHCPHIPTYLIELKHTIFALTIGGKLDAMKPFHTMLNELEASSISLVVRVHFVFLTQPLLETKPL